MFGNASNIELCLMVFALGAGILMWMIFSEMSEQDGGLLFFLAALVAFIATAAGLAGCVYYTLLPDRIFFYEDPRVDQILQLLWLGAAVFWLLAIVQMVIYFRQRVRA